MTTMQSSQNIPGVQSNGLRDHQFSQPQVRFEPTPLSFHTCMSLPFVSGAQMPSYLTSSLNSPVSNYAPVPQINGNSYHPYQSSQTASSPYSPYSQLTTYPGAGPRLSSSFEEDQISSFLTYRDTTQSYD